MQRNYDPLTYRHPRTAIQAFGCVGDEAVALHKMRRAPVTPASVVLYVAATCLAVAAALLVIFS